MVSNVWYGFSWGVQLEIRRLLVKSWIQLCNSSQLVFGTSYFESHPASLGCRISLLGLHNRGESTSTRG